jgi:hypothetical protein
MSTSHDYVEKLELIAWLAAHYNIMYGGSEIPTDINKANVELGKTIDYWHTMTLSQLKELRKCTVLIEQLIRMNKGKQPEGVNHELWMCDLKLELSVMTSDELRDLINETE